MISQVMDFMKAEGYAGGLLIDCKKVRERTQATTGASRIT